MRALLVLGAAGLLVAGCGGSGSSASPKDIARAADRTAGAGSLEADFSVSGQGLSGSGSGVFNSSTDGTGQVRMTLSAGGRQIPVETVISGDVFYLRSPAFAQALTRNKQWIKLDLKTLSSRTGNDLSGILDASPTPANALAYLRGSGRVDEVGSDRVGGAKTTHYDVTVNLDRAAEHARGSTRDAVRGVIAQSGIKTLPLDVWVDGSGYIRKVSYEEHAGRRQAAQVTMELHDFGKRVSITPPPKDSVVDLTRMAG